MGNQRKIQSSTGLPTRPRRVLRAGMVAATAGALFLAGCGAADDETAGDATTTTAEATTIVETTTITVETTPEAAEEEARYVLEGDLPLEVSEVNDMIDFIETETGREFLHPPTIVAQDEAAFEAGLAEKFEDAIASLDEDAERSARTYQALGLSEQSPGELATNMEALVTSTDGIGGYYEPDDDALYVPVTDEATDMFRGVLVHELLHALDGQHVDLGAIVDLIESEPVETERNFGLLALVEGRATLVQQRWMMANGVAPTVPEFTPILEAVPPAVINEISMPYGFGAGFIDANGGAAETWDFYENGLTSSEQVLFTDTDLTEEIVDVPVPEADGGVIFSGPFGASYLTLWLLSESLAPGQALVDSTLLAADGWAGGSMVLWGDDTESCVRIAVAADTEIDLTELETALQAWVDDGEGRTIETTDDLVTVTGCAPFSQ